MLSEHFTENVRFRSRVDGPSVTPGVLEWTAFLSDINQCLADGYPGSPKLRYTSALVVIFPFRLVWICRGLVHACGRIISSALGGGLPQPHFYDMIMNTYAFPVIS